jgi:hypothetical protein
LDQIIQILATLASIYQKLDTIKPEFAAHHHYWNRNNLTYLIPLEQQKEKPAFAELFFSI